MNFIQQKDCCSAPSTCLGVRKTTFPEAGKCRIRLITCSVDGGIAKLFGDLEKQRCLADLKRRRPTEQVCATFWGLGVLF